MFQRSCSAVEASLLSQPRHRNGSFNPTCVTLVICVLAVVCMNFGIASAATESPNDLKSGRGLPSTGDAPNSSVCRHRLNQVVGHAAKCNISRDFRGCRFDSGFISYLEFQYCQFSSPVAPTILMVLWLFTLLGAFAVIADSFFSPSLIALARSMHMSQNLAVSFYFHLPY
uniref:Na_Ca_ex domain-containing protein n=1 Tax=Mesocestoides corti TaxID=53468 RepID=A0A5K3F6Q4_MESCO